MARLTSPVGTVVEVSDELAEKLARRGWEHVNEPVKAPVRAEPVEPETVEPVDEPVKAPAKRKPGRPKKS